MNNASAVHLALLFAAVLGACSVPMGGRDGPPGGGGGFGERGGARSAVSQSPIDQIREQLRETAESLELTPTQRVEWERYQESVGALLADQMKIEPHQARRTALQVINGRVDTVRNRLAAMEEIAERAARLYQALDEKQRKIADQRLPGTVPALYSGLVCQGGGETGGDRPGGRGGPGGGGMGRF